MDLIGIPKFEFISLWAIRLICFRYSFILLQFDFMSADSTLTCAANTILNDLPIVNDLTNQLFKEEDAIR